VVYRRRSRADVRKSLLFVLCLIPFWVSETVRTLGWDDPACASPACWPRLLVDLGITARPSRCSTPMRRSSWPRLHVAAVHGRAARERCSRASTIRWRGRRTHLAARLVDPAAAIVSRTAAPCIAAGAIVVFMLTARQLPDADSPRRQEPRLVHRSRHLTRSSSRASIWEQGAAFGLSLLLA
jgi:spermidine/putrescine transport system permease protein